MADLMSFPVAEQSEDREETEREEEEDDEDWDDEDDEDWDYKEEWVVVEEEWEEGEEVYRINLSNERYLK